MQRLLDAVPFAQRDQHDRAALFASHDHRLIVLHHAIKQFRQILARLGVGGDVDHGGLLLCCTTYRTDCRTLPANPWRRRRGGAHSADEPESHSMPTTFFIVRATVADPAQRAPFDAWY